MQGISYLNASACIKGFNLRRALLTTVGLAGIMSLASPALGQTSDVSDDAATQQEQTGIHEILVTAQRRTQSLQDVPIAISAFGEDSLAERGISSVSELGSVDSGLNIKSDSGTVMPFLRGIGNQSANLIGNEASVPVYIDEVYYTRSSPVYLQIANIERVEVLKGPQGTLFGRNSSGGLIHVITRDPDLNAVRLEGQLGYGNFDTISGHAYMSTPLSDRVAVDFSVSGLHQGDGWGTNLVTGKDTYRQKYINIRSKLVAELTDTTQMKLIGFYSRLRSQQFSIQTVLEGTVSATNPFYGDPQPLPSPADTSSFYDIATDVDPYDDFESFGGSLRIEQELGFGDLVSITSYREADEYYIVDGDYSAFNFLKYRPASIDRQFTQELQLKSNGDSKVDWVVGAFFLDSKQGYNPTTITGDALAFFGLGQQDIFGVQRIKSYSGYGQTTFPLAENTNLTLGLRYTRDDVNGKGRQEATILGTDIRFPVTAALGGQDPYDETFKFEKLTYKVSIDHQIDDALVYASISRGYKSGTFNTLPLVSDATRPEVVDSYEIGVKGDLFGNNIRYNAAVFQNDISDPQVQALLVQGQTTFVGLTNAEKARSRGAELGVEAVLGDGLLARFGATYLDAKYLDFENAILYTPITDGSGNPVPPYGNNAGMAIDASGNQLARVPKWRMNGGINYTLDTSSAGSFIFDINVDYSSRMYWEANNFYSQDPYAMVNSSLTWQPHGDDSLYVRLWGKNLTDKELYNAILAIPGSPGNLAAASAPRTYGIDIGFKM